VGLRQLTWLRRDGPFRRVGRTVGLRLGLGAGALVDVPLVIICVDCGGRAHLLTVLDDEPVEPGDVIAYRCEDCLDRWDIVMEDDSGPDDGVDEGTS